jgi:hypothetical protein
MKNIHVLPTDKPSRLFMDDKTTNIYLSLENNLFKNGLNIYITSDEEIKEGDWFYQGFDSIIHKCYKLTDNYVIADKPSDYPKNICKKIILTTDQELIKDGVQAIDDEFLEWFVNNPSCEEVEVKKIELNTDYRSDWKQKFRYKIIIPKEEPKPHSFCETPKEKCTMNYCDENGCQNRVRHLVEPKQETLTYTEAAKKEERIFNSTMMSKQETLEEAAERQAERMYSEEEVLELLYQHTEDLLAGKKLTLEKWFEQFKKK